MKTQDLPGSIAIPQPFGHKAAGWIFMNGNVVWEKDLVEMFRPRILEPGHFDPSVDKKRKVLLVTAAFQRGQEHSDRHLIAIFERLGIDAGWNRHLPHNIQNLSVYTMFDKFKHQEPWLYSRYTEKQDLVKAIKRDYTVKNQSYVSLVQRHVEALREKYPSIGLFEFYHASPPGRGMDYLLFAEESLVKHPNSQERIADLKKLSASPANLKLCEEMHRTVEHLLYKDEEVFALCRSVETHFMERSGIYNSSLYQDQRAELIDRILSSASIFLFGGRVYVLVNRLRFYDLAQTFAEALSRGSNLYGISAGSISMTERFSLTFDRAETGGHIHAADFGMGLVKGIRVFPHANDFRSIREGRRDDLSFFALRMPHEVAVGLNESSVLLCETYKDPWDGNIYKRFSSAGADPVLVFGTRGERHAMPLQSEILLEGSKFYEDKPELVSRQEVVELEQKWRKATPMRHGN